MKRKKILLSSMKKPSSSADCSESRIKISVPASFPSIGQFLQGLSLLDAGKCTFNWRLSEQFSESQAALGTIVFRWVSESQNKLSEDCFSKDFQH